MMSAYGRKNLNVELFGGGTTINCDKGLEKVAKSLNNIACAIRDAAYINEELRRLEMMTPQERREYERIQEREQLYASIM